MTALGNMQSGLAARVEADRKAADAERARAVAGERIKQALDASSVNVVVCRRAGQHHLSESGGATASCPARATDFRQVQPRFDAEPPGRNELDVFYADGARQRERIAALRQSATSQFVVGCAHAARPSSARSSMARASASAR